MNASICSSLVMVKLSIQLPAVLSAEVDVCILWRSGRRVTAGEVTGVVRRRPSRLAGSLVSTSVVGNLIPVAAVAIVAVDAVGVVVFALDNGRRGGCGSRRRTSRREDQARASRTPASGGKP